MDTGKPAAEAGLRYTYFSGVRIGLEGDRRLEPLAVFEGRATGYPPPIDPPIQILGPDGT